MEKFEYFIVLFLVVFPIVIMMFNKKSMLKNREKNALIAIVISAIPFLIWDYFATARGHWSFNPNFNMGIYITNLPLEEIMFFITVPLACLYVWCTIKRFDSLKDLINYIKK